jgi:ABC-2 type transport system permease protein
MPHNWAVDARLPSRTHRPRARSRTRRELESRPVSTDNRALVASGLLGVGIDLKPLSILGVIAVIVLGAALFSTFSLIIACAVKTRERFMGIGQVLTMPIFFASNAIYPLALMPSWLRVVSHLNPLTYEVDALRNLLLSAGVSDYGLTLDFGVLLGTTAVLIAIAARMYARMGY